jgi:hypothetical protein
MISAWLHPYHKIEVRILNCHFFHISTLPLIIEMLFYFTMNRKQNNSFIWFSEKNNYWYKLKSLKSMPENCGLCALQFSSKIVKFMFFSLEITIYWFYLQSWFILFLFSCGKMRLKHLNYWFIPITFVIFSCVINWRIIVQFLTFPVHHT